jgi:predicted DNA-binding mobile mystery protein A
MKPEFRNLRLRQLARSLAPFVAARSAVRPDKGWLRAIREASGTSLRELANRMGTSPQSAAQFEKSEAEFRITLKSLRDAANALDCDLVYALVPRSGNVEQLAHAGITEEAAERLLAVEHSMALEDQAVGDIDTRTPKKPRRVS